jgi:Glycosyltransferase sugar-binding region containing DXD motif
MSCPLKFHFFWGKGTAFPYIRYLSLATCRVHHPDSEIKLFMCRCQDLDKWNQGVFSDFQFNGDELRKIYETLEKDGLKIEEATRKQVYDTLLDGKEPAPWDRIRYDQKAIEDAIRANNGTEGLAGALGAIVEKRKVREARKGKKHDYVQDAVERLGVKLCEYEPADARVYTMPPPNVSDIFSVEVLMREGGVYMDCDQVVLRNLLRYTANYDFFMGGQMTPYVGIFGSKPDGRIVNDFYKRMMGSYDEHFYNSTGIQAILKDCIQNNEWMANFSNRALGEANHILEQEAFYPLFAHDGAVRFWKGDFDINGCNSTCVHFYGGNPVSNQACRELGPENILAGNHCYAQYLRKLTNGGNGLKHIFCWD